MEKTFSKLKALAIIDKEIIASNAYKIFSSKNEGKDWNLVNIVPVYYYQKFLSRIRILQRLFRFEISLIKKISDSNIIICCNKNMFISDLEFKNFKRVNINFRSYQLLNHSICIAKENIYYAEYFPNPKRKEVNIYKSSNGLDWEIIYTFKKKQIKHIHGIQYDPFIDKLWFCTGDLDKECMIAKTDLDFSDIEIIGKNDQIFRTIELLFFKDKVYWAMDSPVKKNHLIEFERKNKKIKQLQEFDSPVYSLKKMSEGYYIIATTSEKGLADTDKKAHIWISNDLKKWEDLLSYNKDILPNIFGHGRILFPDKFNDKLIFSGSGLEKIENKMIIGTIK